MSFLFLFLLFLHLFLDISGNTCGVYLSNLDVCSHPARSLIQTQSQWRIEIHPFLRITYHMYPYRVSDACRHPGRGNLSCPKIVSLPNDPGGPSKWSFIPAGGMKARNVLLFNDLLEPSHLCWAPTPTSKSRWNVLIQETTLAWTSTHCALQRTRKANIPSQNTLHTQSYKLTHCFILTISSAS